MNFKYITFSFMIIPLLLIIMTILLSSLKGRLIGVISLAASVVQLFMIFSLIKPIVIQGNATTIWFKNGIGFEVDAVGVLFIIAVSLIMLMLMLYLKYFGSKDDDIYKYYILTNLFSFCAIVITFSGDLFLVFLAFEIISVLSLFYSYFITGKKFKLKEKIVYFSLEVTSLVLIVVAMVFTFINLKSFNIGQLAIVYQVKEKFTVSDSMVFIFLFLGYGIKVFNNIFYLNKRDGKSTFEKYFNLLLVNLIAINGIYLIYRIVYTLFNLGSNIAVINIFKVMGLVLIIMSIFKIRVEKKLSWFIELLLLYQIGYIILSLGLTNVGYEDNSIMSVVGSLNHTLSTFSIISILILASAFLESISNNLAINKITGLGKRVPSIMFIFICVFIAIIGIPPFDGFSSKLTILETSFKETTGIITILISLSTLIILLSLFNTMQAMFFGPKAEEKISEKEEINMFKLMLILMTIIIVVMGIFAKNITSKFTVKIVEAVLRPKGYIFGALENKVNVNTLIEKNEVYKYIGSNVNNEGMLVIVFIIVFLTITGLLLFKGKNAGEEVKEGQDTVFDLSIFKKYKDELKFNQKKSQARFVEGCKYDVFVGGEEGDKVKIGYDDMIKEISFKDILKISNHKFEKYTKIIRFKFSYVVILIITLGIIYLLAYM